MTFDSPWFRFGLPLGSALILLAFLDLWSNVYMAWMDLAGYIIEIASLKFENDPDIIIWYVESAVRISSCLGFLCYGVLSKVYLPMLLAWITTTAVCAIVTIGLQLYYTFQHSSEFWRQLYTLVITTLIYAYIMNIGIQSAWKLKKNEPLIPTGHGFKHILKFYREDPALAAKLLLTSELVSIGLYVIARQLFILLQQGNQGHEGNITNPAIMAEEFVLRAIRIVLNSVGLYLIGTSKFGPLKYWGFANLGTIIVSLCLLIYLIITWRADGTDGATLDSHYTVSYYLMFTISLIYRSGTLFVCMKVREPHIPSTTLDNLQDS